MRLPRLAPHRFALSLVLALPVPALAADPVRLAGGGREIALSLEALRALPAQTRAVAFETSRGQEQGVYRGAPLWDLLVGNGLIDPAAHGAVPRLAIIVTAGDGYMLVLSAGELAPDLGNAAAFLAYERDGAPLPAARSPRLVMPGDRRGARQVLDVARIELRRLDTPASPPTEIRP